MLHKINYATILVLFCLPTWSIAQNTAEEKAVLKVVNDEITAFMTRDYDKWANTMAHKPYTSSFWGGYNNYNHAEGWENLSQNIQNLVQNNSPLPAPPPLENAIITINGNMAAVRGESDGHIRLCVLEKENGQWKLIQIAAVHKDGYDMHNLMNRVEGDWLLDKASLQVENNPGSIDNLEAHIEKLGSKFSMVSTLTWKNGSGGMFEATETLEIVPNMNVPEAKVLRSFTWHNGGADAFSGALVREGNTFSGQLTSIGGNNAFNLSLDFSENNRIHCSYQIHIEEGEEGWSIQYDLIRD